jgi:hypothetical protein
MFDAFFTNMVIAQQRAGGAHRTIVVQSLHDLHAFVAAGMKN